MTSVDLGPGLRYRDHYRRGFRAGLPLGLAVVGLSAAAALVDVLLRTVAQLDLTAGPED